MQDVKAERAREWNAVARGLPDRDTSIFAITTTAAPALLDAVGGARGAHLLDVACGPGTLVGEARRRGIDFTGIDLAADMIDEARRLHPGVEFRVGDAENLDFPDSTFDCVTSNFGVQMLPDPVRAFAEARRVLKPGGRYGFTTFHDGPADDLFRLVQEAVAAEGTPVPAKTFWGLDDCVRLLAAAGFEDVTAGERILVGTLESGPEQVLDVIATAGRPWYLLKPQTPEQRTRIDRAIVAGAARHRDGDRIALRVSTILATGRNHRRAT
ncbi:MAG: class I SAM-dependent methyltransferase [Kofleriaceae bacterium]